jgi:hypothetical protein
MAGSQSKAVWNIATSGVCQRRILGDTGMTPGIGRIGDAVGAGKAVVRTNSDQFLFRIASIYTFFAHAHHVLDNSVPPRDCNMSSKTFPEVSSTEPLPDLVSKLEKHVSEVRRGGNPAAILVAANAAADVIEQRVGVCSNDAERAALIAVKRFTWRSPGQFPDSPR